MLWGRNKKCATLGLPYTYIYIYPSLVHAHPSADTHTHTRLFCFPSLCVYIFDIVLYLSATTIPACLRSFQQKRMEHNPDFHVSTKKVNENEGKQTQKKKKERHNGELVGSAANI
ncbi:hypothetical protein, unlikely [Trypanosoma brucei gambiense DAL972]|uniref:Uncharacterized protein n=1 Tax=Trypanosoma brucei gambiense (strain MHOM/CI/86/DAL972) TaxID=679716 RepID=C9ZP29_TRYB9|nr:hypothetical protein, unlikely [Trypanosoma brucei gambiense DAL972]CBH11157.1 hypothetical protein, unlikely [Trypanosoma brucei gambiense DAL972]|eukprot:XP_011773444.1 hypothetical protein, unlikely [Trypanosoma brucei gambiense DAL972]